MQQLSLFDFGEEKPKESKKKNPPKTEKSEEASSEELLAQENIPAEEASAENDTSVDSSPEEEFSTDFIPEELEEDFADADEYDISFETVEETIDDTATAEAITIEAEPQESLTEEIKEEKIVTKKRGRKSFKEIDKEVDLIDVPPDEELFQKQYYPISTVAQWFRVNTSLLRFWENQFKILKPKKNKKGDRFFRPEDVKNLKLIYYLLRQKKLTIDGANKHLKAHKQHTEENLQLINSLNNFKSFLLELKVNCER